ncbi:MAG: hypothetical protein L0H41_00045 [Microlunatus sp.]|nr:hypothetical protein [Microlunatus sp.]
MFGPAVHAGQVVGTLAGSASGAAAPVQREPDDAPDLAAAGDAISTPEAVTSTGETVPPPAGSVASASPPPASPSGPADLDEMARRLYEPLAARLRAELWLDRERAGVIGDV